MHIHDSGYKKLFSNHTIFRQLIETFVHEAWVTDLDFDHCETVDKSFVSAHYKETESDLIYKVRFKGREAYIFVLLEFQSAVDRFMALRVLNYVTNFYMDYVESRPPAAYLPPVFPVVLYNGDERWTAPTRFMELLDGSVRLGEYAPQFTYLKLVEHEYAPEELVNIHNIVSTLFLAETRYEREFIKQQLVSLFQHEDDRQAVSLLLNWLRQLAEHKRIAPADYGEFEQVYHSVEEVRSMLVKALERERERERAEGRAEGLIEGLRQGITTLLAAKFGSQSEPLVDLVANIQDVLILQEVLQQTAHNSDLEELSALITVSQRAAAN